MREWWFDDTVDLGIRNVSPQHLGNCTMFVVEGGWAGGPLQSGEAPGGLLPELPYSYKAWSNLHWPWYNQQWSSSLWHLPSLKLGVIGQVGALTPFLAARGGSSPCSRLHTLGSALPFMSVCTRIEGCISWACLGGRRKGVFPKLKWVGPDVISSNTC